MRTNTTKRAQLLTLQRLRTENSNLRKNAKKLHDLAVKNGVEAENAKKEANLAGLQRELIKALRWKDPSTDDETIGVQIRIDRDQIVSERNMELLWAHVMGQLGVAFGSKMREHSTAAMKAAFGKKSRGFLEAKDRWLCSDPVMLMGVGWETANKLWDMAVEAVKGEVGV